MTLNFGDNYEFGQGIPNRFENNYDFKTQTSNYIDKATTVDETSLYSLQEKFDDIKDRQVIYYFDVIKSHKIQLQSQITDYWLENNTAVQDTINLSPIIITLSGLVGEVIYTPSSTITGFLTDKLNNMFPSNNGFTLTQKLGTIASLIPNVDNYTQLAKNALGYTENAFKRYKKVYDTFFKKGTTSTKLKQQQIYESFQEFWLNKTSLIVNTPYGTFENMYILNVSMEQGDTNTVSNVSVTLKQLTFSEIEYTKADKKVLEKYNSQAQAETENLGKTKNKEVRTQSYLKQGVNWVFSAVKDRVGK